MSIILFARYVLSSTITSIPLCYFTWNCGITMAGTWCLSVYVNWKRPYFVRSSTQFVNAQSPCGGNTQCREKGIVVYYSLTLCDLIFSGRNRNASKTMKEYISSSTCAEKNKESTVWPAKHPKNHFVLVSRHLENQNNTKVSYKAGSSETSYS